MAQIEFTAIQVFDGRTIFVGVRLEDELLDDAALSNTCSAQNHQAKAIDLGHVEDVDDDDNGVFMCWLAAFAVAGFSGSRSVSPLDGGWDAVVRSLMESVDV